MSDNKLLYSRSERDKLQVRRCYYKVMLQSVFFNSLGLLKGLIFFLVLTLNNNSVFSQSNNSMVNPWFQVHSISENVWRIEDNHIDNIYLVTGTDSAMLIDNGLGAVNLVDFIRTITKLPLIVINTHGHPDHVGSNNQFEKVYANPVDFDRIRYFSQKETKAKMLKVMLHSPVPDFLKYEQGDSNHLPELLGLKDGQVFDLGKRKLEIIFTPGHTAGSVCILDKTDSLLFTADNGNELSWLHLKESVPLEIYLQSLEKLQQRKKEFKILLPGHSDPIDAAFLGEQIICVRNIISGVCQGKPYKSFAGDGLLCNYKRANVAYDPLKIKAP